jgi:DNA-binding transcriptional ArsR family regulator
MTPETAAAEAPLDILGDARRVAAILPDLRRRLLESLSTPDSAAGLARRLGLPRQKVNYHLRALERAGCVECVGTRRRRGCTERRMRATARAFVLSPDFLGELQADPARIRDRLSSAYLIAAASRMLRDVATLRGRAGSVDRRLPTLTMETEIAFASPASLKAFAEGLAGAVAQLAAQFGSDGGRRFRLVIGAHPVITRTPEEVAAEAALHAGQSGEENRA